MYEVIIVRLEETSQGILGVMLIYGQIFCFTLEPDANDPDRFSIPAGMYHCRRFRGTKWPTTFEILVPGHTALLFHAGNVEADTEGCILLGETTSKLTGHRAVLNSGRTFARFMELTQHRSDFDLLVKDCY